MMISFLFFYVFGILGIQFLMGRIGFCAPEATMANKTECLEANMTWETPKTNYNNIF